jgi:hypothetical protein
VITAVMAVTTPMAAQHRGSGQAGQGCGQALVNQFDQLEPATVTSAEVFELQYLREEEKLARDVYLTLGEQWQLPNFFNIAGAEQRHMDSVLMALEAYEIPDPVVDDAVGAFANQEFASLYTDLVALGEQTLVDALSVGATIEDMDLADLYDLLEMTDNSRIRLVAQNLAKGSRNHLRSFVRALTAQGEAYTPQYLDLDSFEAIIDSDYEVRVVYDSNGDVLATCGRGGSRGRGIRGSGQGNGGQGSGTCTGSGTSGQSSGGQGSGTSTGGGPAGQGSQGDGDCTGDGPGNQGSGQGGGAQDGSCQT